MNRTLLLILIGIALLGALAYVSRVNNQNAHPEDYVKPPEQATLKPGRMATVDTSKGSFKFILFEQDTPITSKNFVDLADKGFYKGLKFHRVESWVVQGGDPTGTGKGGSGKTIKLEIKDGLGFDRAYTVGMARADDPDSATSQFFVTKIAKSDLTGSYAAFGVVFQGQKVVDKLKIGDIIKSITVSDPTKSDLALVAKSMLPQGPPGANMPLGPTQKSPPSKVNSKE